MVTRRAKARRSHRGIDPTQTILLVMIVAVSYSDVVLCFIMQELIHTQTYQYNHTSFIAQNSPTVFREIGVTLKNDMNGSRGVMYELRRGIISNGHP